LRGDVIIGFAIEAADARREPCCAGGVVLAGGIDHAAALESQRKQRGVGALPTAGQSPLFR